MRKDAAPPPAPHRCRHHWRRQSQVPLVVRADCVLLLSTQPPGQKGRPQPLRGLPCASAHRPSPLIAAISYSPSIGAIVAMAGSLVQQPGLAPGSARQQVGLPTGRAAQGTPRRGRPLTRAMWVSLLQRQRPRSGSSPAGGRAAAPPPAPARRAAPVRAAAAATASAAAPKRADAAELAAEVERLKAENEALRVALAGYQKCPPAEVTVATAAAAAAEVAASPAAAPATAADIVTQLEAGIKWPSPQEGNFWERPPREAPMPLGPPTPAGGATRDPRSFHVVHITAEMAPHAKVGGLGDVVTGLARACLGRGHNVEIMLPVSGAAAAAQGRCRPQPRAPPATAAG